jgi:hypothetical protein
MLTDRSPIVGRGLSEDQRLIIRWAGRALLRDRELLEHAEATGLPDVRFVLTLRYSVLHGVEWDRRPGGRDGIKGRTPSRRAAISRALRRLEQRGLVRRMDGSLRSGDDRIWPTHLVQLTDSGWDVYRRLTDPAEDDQVED